MALAIQRERPSCDQDASACLTAFQLHLDYVFASLRRMRVLPADREDQAQNVFLALRSSWPTIDPRRPFKPYLFGIVFRVVCAYRRARFRRLPPKLVDEDHEPLATPHELLEAEHARAVVLAALDTVPLTRRAALVMHYIDGVPVADVARALSISSFAVYARLKKGRGELNAAVRRRVGKIGAL